MPRTMNMPMATGMRTRMNMPMDTCMRTSMGMPRSMGTCTSISMKENKPEQQQQVSMEPEQATKAARYGSLSRP